MKKIIFTNKHGHKFIVTNMELAEAVERYRPSIGLDARWLPEYLEGAETRSILIKESTETEEAEYILEYLHPAEYTYEIIEETLEEIKARKLAELSALSISMNTELKKWNEYRASNMLAGIYDEAKQNEYKQAYLDKSEALRNEYYRCKALVESASSEEQINNIQFMA